MKKWQEQSLLWFIIYLVVLGSVILLISSCTVSGRGYGCPGPQQGWVGCGGNR